MTKAYMIRRAGGALGAVHGAFAGRALANRAFGAVLRGKSRTYMSASKQAVISRVAGKGKSKAMVTFKRPHKRKLNEKIIGGVGGTNTYCRHRIGHYNNVIKKVLKDIPLQCYSNSYPGQLTTGSGVQAVQTTYAVGGVADLDFIRTNIAFQNAGNANPIAVSQRAEKVHMLSALSNLMITNLSNRNAKVFLYDVVCRRDSVAIPSSSWITGIQDVTNNVAGGNNVVTVLGCHPFQSPAFTGFWRVLSIKEITLPSGSVHTHRFTINFDKIFHGENEYRQSIAGGGSLVNLKDWTHYTMIVLHGYPALDATGHNDPSSGAAEIAYVQTISYNFKMLDSAIQAQNVITTTLTPFPNSETGVSEESNLIAAYQQA